MFLKSLVTFIRTKTAPWGVRLFRGSNTDFSNFSNPDLVLIQTPGWGLKTAPMSLATLTAFVREKNYKVLPLDLNLELYLLRREGFQQVWDDNQADWFWNTESCVRDFVVAHKDLIDVHVDFLVNCGAKLFGFSCYSSCTNLALYYAKEIKRRKPDAVIVFGGPHASRNMAGRRLAARPFINLVAQGEGEHTLLEIVERVARGEPLSGIKGTLHNDDGVVVDNGDRPLIRDLDELPYAALHDYKFEHYWEGEKLPVMASRGCPNRCNFCNEKTYWIAYRGFSPRRISDEIFHQLDRYPHLKRVEFMDSLINAVIPKMLEMARYFIAQPRKFSWASQAVIRKEMTFDVFKTLAESGCNCLAFGLETSSVELMLRTGKVLAKGTNIDELVIDAHRAGLSCAYNFMFGLPGETAEDAAASLDFLHRHQTRLGTVNPSAAFCGFTPGTPAYDHPEIFGVVPGPTHGDQYWETEDGTNTLPVRLARFEAFCKKVMELKIPTTYPHEALLDRDRVLGSYYFFYERYSEAFPYLKNWDEQHPNDSNMKWRYEKCVQELSL